MLTQSTGLALHQQAAYRDRGYHFEPWRPMRLLASLARSWTIMNVIASAWTSAFSRRAFSAKLTLPALGLPAGVPSARA